jgi:hypothetical protein
MDYYVEYLKELDEARIVARPPNTFGAWQGDGVVYETFALEECYRPPAVFEGIIDSTLDFSPVALLRAVEKARKEQHNDEAAKSNNEGSDDNDDADNGDNTGPGVGSPVGTKAKKTRLPPLQPAFTNLMEEIETALDSRDLGSLRTSFGILSDMTKVMKVSKQKNTDETALSAATMQYVRDSHKSAKEAAKQQALLPDNSDHSSDASDHAGTASIEAID